MEPHFIELPKMILIGNRVLPRIPEVCRSLGAGKGILILCDRTTKEIAGNKVRQFLEKEGLQAEMDLVDDSTSTEVDRIGAKKGPDLIIGVGGGRVIDVSKMVAYRKDISFVSVPTAPSHDGIASERASIRGMDGGKYSIRARPPAAIVADIGILRTAPYRFIASGAADVISNYTAVKDWRLAHQDKKEYYSEYASALALLSSEIVIGSSELIRETKERGIRNLMEALVSSSISMSLAGTSRPASGSEHAFSHALDMIAEREGMKSGLHGEQCGIGAILMACHHGMDWERIRDSLEKIGAPVTAGQLGIGRETVISALLEARNIRKRYTILDKKPLDRGSAEKLCRDTGVLC